MDPYAVLGIAQNASEEELKKAYRAKCKEYHPDVNGGSLVAEEKFKEVQAAYNEINDRRSGKHTQQNTAYGYDPFQAHRTQGGTNRTYTTYTYGNVDFEELFREAYRRQYQQQTYQQQHQQQQNDDPFAQFYRRPRRRFSIISILFWLWVAQFLFQIFGSLLSQLWHGINLLLH